MQSASPWRSLCKCRTEKQSAHLGQPGSCSLSVNLFPCCNQIPDTKQSEGWLILALGWGGIVCHGGRGCEAAGHIAPTVRRQRDESPCLARFLFTQSRAPVQGRVPPTFQVGLPLELRQSRKPLRHAQRCASGDCRLRQEDNTKQLHSWQIRFQPDSQISQVGPGQMVEETHQGLSSLSTQSVFI